MFDYKGYNEICLNDWFHITNNNVFISIKDVVKIQKTHDLYGDSTCNIYLDFVVIPKPSLK